MSDVVKNRFIGAKSVKKIQFMDQELEIRKLNINQVIRIQNATKEAETKKDEQSGISILSVVIREGAPELADLSQEDLQDFPMEDLSKLSNAIMEFSGLVPKEPVAPKESQTT